MRRLVLFYLLLGSCALLAAEPAAKKAAAAKLEPYLMLPEPRVMRTERSVTPAAAQRTVLSPAREMADSPGIEIYPAEDFKKLGLSPESFLQRSQRAADRLLSVVTPEVIKNAAGQPLYAVYRGERPIYASLLVAPQLPGVFKELFGEEIWAVLPDRNSLYIFPAKPEALEDFLPDLLQRFQDDAHAASGEIFALRTGAEPRVVAAFAPGA
jgi:hypothetical protein